jgi:DNA-binding NtrC family response regulator
MPFGEPVKDERRQKLLLVDDEPLILDVCGALLKSYGFEVIPARNAKAGLDLFRKHLHSIDLVISDLLLPDMSGPQMVRQMKSEKPGLKSVFMSGYGAGTVLSAEPEADLQLIVKPFTSDQLLHCIRGTLQKPIAASSRG